MNERSLKRFGILFAAFFLWGCSEELGPETWETTTVSGTVTVSGRPVTSGWVEFLPISGTRGNLRSAPIGRDGSFTATRVPVGKIAVAMENIRIAPIPSPLGSAYAYDFRFFRTPIHRVVPAGSSTRVDVDLAKEAADMFKTRLENRRRLNNLSE